MKRDILKNGFTFLLCLIITYVLFFYFVSNYIYRLMTPSTFLYISLMIFTVFLLYTLAISLINKKFNKVNIDILSIMYFIVVIGVSFYKSTCNYNGMNLNPFSIINDFKTYFHSTLLQVIGNALIYLPLGVYIRYKIKAANSKLVIGFILYILLIETMQFVFHRGIFDVNDIVLNTLGFVIGIYFYKLLHNRATKHRIG